MNGSVHVRAPCRLHFGMFSFGHADRPQFGGVGVMVEPPAVEVSITRANRFSASGSLAKRVEHFAAVAARNWKLLDLPACDIHVQSPPDHVGLGVGTQLGLSVAAGLRRYLNLPDLSIVELALCVGRGLRSAVGMLGFAQGGLIVDAGKRGASPRRHACLVKVPAEWRFVLVRPSQQRGLAGEREAGAFARLPPVPFEVTDELCRIADEQMVPAIERCDCTEFGEAAYRFGRLAGECFTAVQGGPFASTQVGTLVEAIRRHGVPGVGQSSWGPTVFAVVASDTEAQALTEWLRAEFQLADNDVTIAQPNNRGAIIEVTSG